MVHCEDLGCMLGICGCGCEGCMAEKRREDERFAEAWAPRSDCDALAARVKRLTDVLDAGIEAVSHACALADAAAGDTEHAYAWEKVAAAWLAAASAALACPPALTPPAESTADENGKRGG